VVIIRSPGGDVVLDEDGDAMQRPARPLGFALPVEFRGDGKGIRVDFNDGVNGGRRCSAISAY
jgi:hypothetical protein